MGGPSRTNKPGAAFGEPLPGGTSGLELGTFSLFDWLRGLVTGCSGTRAGQTETPPLEHPALQERVKAEIRVFAQNGLIQAFIPGRYIRDCDGAEPASPTTIESVIRLAEQIMRLLSSHPRASVNINLEGLSSFEGRPEKNDEIAAKRAQMVRAILQAQFESFGVDLKRVGFAVSHRTAEKTEEQAQIIAELCRRRQTSEPDLIRDYNDGARGFLELEVAMLDDILARKRGVNVKASIKTKTGAD